MQYEPTGDRDTKICGASNIQCYNQAEDKLLEQDFTEGLSTTTAIRKGCNCLPACTSITYDAEISQAKFDWVNLFIAYKNPLDEFPGWVRFDRFYLLLSSHISCCCCTALFEMIGLFIEIPIATICLFCSQNILHLNFQYFEIVFSSMQPARLSIYFKEHQFITSKRSELYGQTDFLANCGGLLGLFMGVSVLSIIEVIYYCTLRLGCTLRIRKTRKQRRNAIAPTENKLPCIQIDTADEKKHHQN